MKALLLAALTLTLVSLAFCIPAAARNGRSTQASSRSRGVKIAGESEKAVVKNGLQNSEREPVRYLIESPSVGIISTNQNATDGVRKSRKSEEKSRSRGKKRRTEGTVSPTTTTTTTQATESTETSESDFVFENDKTVQHVDEEEPVDESTKPPQIGDSKDVTTESAVTTNKVNTVEVTSQSKPVTSKKQEFDENVPEPAFVDGYHEYWPQFNDFQESLPDYSMPQMEALQYEPPLASWNFNELHNFYPLPLLEESLPWSPFRDQLYETPDYSMWSEEEQFYEIEPYWWNGEVSTNEGKCNSKTKKKTATTTTTTSTTTTRVTTTAATTTSSSVVTEPTTTATTFPTTTTTTAAETTTVTPIPNPSSTWQGIEDLLETYKLDVTNDADASSRGQLTKLFHEILQQYEPLLNGSGNKKAE
ncbi:hypothetical protein ECG_08064 [Echinococcus granulosus]|uniref:Expressed conserved protein n=1 Tax=Echinococcus granulosus TaxID=6210 RepID=U6JIJ4_ECHGR|nr:hypothetical protein EGR_08625 [Echinococcus granulosus]EUB56503.1 hypothetical protein EGR_08625 [Echinococcus granulosus]KAH9279140.1 hypothetical protein ECG_08064 [Echinococcus granulosus]CDS23848.1 expressed conserved protein [Echinococcus granulosus]